MNSKQLRNRILKASSQPAQQNLQKKEQISYTRNNTYKYEQPRSKASPKQSPISKQGKQLKVEDCRNMLQDSLNSIENLLKIIKTDDSTKIEEANLYDQLQLQMSGTFYLSPGRLSTIKQQGQQDQVIQTQKKKYLSRVKSVVFQKFDSRYSTIPKNDQDQLLISQQNSLLLRHEGKFQNQVKQWSQFRKKSDEQNYYPGQEVLDETHQQLVNSRDALLEKIRINRKKSILIIPTYKKENGCYKSVKAKLHYNCPQELFDKVCALLRDQGIYIKLESDKIQLGDRSCQIPEKACKKGLKITKKLAKPMAYQN